MQKINDLKSQRIFNDRFFNTAQVGFPKNYPTARGRDEKAEALFSARDFVALKLVFAESFKLEKKITISNLSLNTAYIVSFQVCSFRFCIASNALSSQWLVSRLQVLRSGGDLHNRQMLFLSCL
jgi:hypothetical protein